MAYNQQGMNQHIPQQHVPNQGYSYQEDTFFRNPLYRDFNQHQPFFNPLNRNPGYFGSSDHVYATNCCFFLLLVQRSDNYYYEL